MAGNWKVALQSHPPDLLGEQLCPDMGFLRGSKKSCFEITSVDKNPPPPV